MVVLNVMKAWLHCIASSDARVFPFCPADVAAFWRRQMRGMTFEIVTVTVSPACITQNSILCQQPGLVCVQATAASFVLFSASQMLLYSGGRTSQLHHISPEWSPELCLS